MVLFDTNICVYVLAGTSEPLRRRLAAQEEGSLAISTITVAELSAGRRSRPHQEERLSRFLDAMRMLPFDLAAAERLADVPFRRGSYDRLIAAHALSLNLTLVTNNERDFADVPGLRVENWTR
jgi:tRNA(fMet)-specific endonuclease VapC